jgi:hypothetical protein
MGRFGLVAGGRAPGLGLVGRFEEQVACTVFDCIGFELGLRAPR